MAVRRRQNALHVPIHKCRNTLASGDPFAVPFAGSAAVDRLRFPYCKKMDQLEKPLHEKPQLQAMASLQMEAQRKK